MSLAGTSGCGDSFDYKSFQAGRLQHFVKNWKALNAPLTLIKLIQGFRIPFCQKPPLHLPKVEFQTPFSREMQKAVQSLLKMRVLEPADPSPSFVSPMFLTPKSDGSSRPIFNLKRLNMYLPILKFRLVNMHRIPAFLQRSDWLVKIDLSNAYFHLPVAQSHKRFLRLIFNGQLLQMTCLPFGLACAPKMFASLTNWVAQILREKGFRILIYLDDFLLVNQDPQVLRKQTLETVHVLEQLGWQINYAKSTLTPQKVLEYLGIVWDPHSNMKYLPLRKCIGIKQKVKAVLRRELASLKEIQSVVGSINFASFPVPRGRLNHRALLKHCQNLLYLPSNRRYSVPREALIELTWWLNNVTNSSLIHYPPVSHYLVTDASMLAWGALIDNVKLWGQWPHGEANLHSNQREMLAVLHALEDRCRYLAHSSLMIQSDNKTVVSYLRNEGGTRSTALMNLCYRIFHLLDHHNIHLECHYLPGRYNCEADRLSRLSPTPEWHLLPIVTAKLFSKWGTPVVDLFASATAHVVPKYVSLDVTDPQAQFHDAFSQTWHFQLAWVFPPPFLIPRVLSHLNTATGMYLFVVPRWLKVFWRPDLRNRALAPPFTIFALDRVLIDTITGQPPPQVQDMTLEVWKCGGGRRV